MLSVRATVIALSCALSYAAPVLTGPFTGDITFYQPGLGSCGETNSDSDKVVALSPSQFTQMPQACGATINITGPDNKTTTAKVVDKCPACASGSIDVSSAVFQDIASLDVGRAKVSWSFAA